MPKEIKGRLAELKELRRLRKLELIKLKPLEQIFLIILTIALGKRGRPVTVEGRTIGHLKFKTCTLPVKIPKNPEFTNKEPVTIHVNYFEDKRGEGYSFSFEGKYYNIITGKWEVPKHSSDFYRRLILAIEKTIQEPVGTLILH